MEETDVPLTLRVLVAMGPRAPVEILAIRKRDVQAIEGAKQLFGSPELLKDLDNLRLCSGFPGHLLMSGGISVIHATLEADGKVISSPRLRVVFIEAEFEALEPSDLLVNVVLCTLRRDGTLDEDASVLVELVAPVAVDSVLVKLDQIPGLELGAESLLLLGLSRRCESDSVGRDSGCGHCSWQAWVDNCC